VDVKKALQAVVWKAKRSTSLHVHIGRGEHEEPFSLQEVKRIAMLVVRFEGKVFFSFPFFCFLFFCSTCEEITV
jgi:hypothetical protein